MKDNNCKVCKRELPQGYKYSTCENCRNKRANNVKKYSKVAMGVLAVVGTSALTIVKKMK